MNLLASATVLDMAMVLATALATVPATQTVGAEVLKGDFLSSTTVILCTYSDVFNFFLILFFLIIKN